MDKDEKNAVFPFWKKKIMLQANVWLKDTFIQI